MTTSPLLGRVEIEAALQRLGDRLHRRGIIADVYVVDGAAMVLAYDARRATRDIDAVFEPHGAVLEAAWAVADELDLPRHWLNDQAASYISTNPDTDAPQVFDHPGLRVSAASPEHLLAMKTLAGRRFADRDDLETLVRHLGLTTVDQVTRICAQVFPTEPVSGRARLLLDEVINSVHATDPRGTGANTTPPEANGAASAAAGLSADPDAADAHGVRCRVCGRVLTAPDSIARGIGPGCARHEC